MRFRDSAYRESVQQAVSKVRSSLESWKGRYPDGQGASKYEMRYSTYLSWLLVQYLVEMLSFIFSV